MDVLYATLRLHVLVGSQKFSQGTTTNDSCKQIIAAAIVKSIALWRRRRMRVLYYTSFAMLAEADQDAIILQAPMSSSNAKQTSKT